MGAYSFYGKPAAEMLLSISCHTGSHLPTKIGERLNAADTYRHTLTPAKQTEAST